MRELPNRFRIACGSNDDALKILKVFREYGFVWQGDRMLADTYFPSDTNVIGLHVDNNIITFSDDPDWFYNHCTEPELQFFDLVQRNTSAAVNSDMLSMF